MSSITTTETFSSLPSHPEVTAPKAYGKINYIPANHTPIPSSHNFHLPSLSEFSDSRTVLLHDLRPLPTISQLPFAKNHTSLSTHNFTALMHPSALHSVPYSYASWKDSNLLTQVYIPETESLVRQITGARKVITESLLLRSVLWTEEDALAMHAGHGHNNQHNPSNPTAQQQQQQQQQAEANKLEADSAQNHHHQQQPSTTSFPQFIGFTPSSGGASPAPKAHQDYTPAGARVHIRKYHPALAAAAHDILASEEASSESALAPRWALYSIWRPLKRVKRDALALGDARSFSEQDYVPVLIRTPSLGTEGEGQGKGVEVHECEAWVARGPGAGREHRWWWVSEQRPEEVLVIGLFDSAREADGVAAGGAMHCSVEVEGQGEEGEARESLELRCLAVW